MNSINNKSIAIVGGGPGGLTLARLLQMQGADVTLYERDAHKDARPKGATLDLHDDSGLLALREAGLIDAFMANYRPGADRLRIMDEHLNIRYEDDVNKNGELSRPEIDRGPLQNILLDSLLPGTVLWDRQFTTLTPRGDGWTIGFKNGVAAYADIVIAADGANSKLRPYITAIKPFYAGVTVLEGVVYNTAVACPAIHKLLNGGKIFAMSKDRSIIVSSKGDGSLVFYPGFKMPEQWVKECGIDFKDKEQVLAWYRREFKEWDPVWEELLLNAEPHYVPRPLYCMPFDQAWQALPNLTMLGDAAHLMPPSAGEGVNMAMLDALRLSQCLTDSAFPNAHAAIAAFEQEMCARASETAKMTMIATEELYGPNAIDFIIGVIS